MRAESRAAWRCRRAAQVPRAPGRAASHAARCGGAAVSGPTFAADSRSAAVSSWSAAGRRGWCLRAPLRRRRVSVSGPRVCGPEEHGTARCGSAVARRRGRAFSRPRGLRPRPSDCNIWTGAIGADGYGRFTSPATACGSALGRIAMRWRLPGAASPRGAQFA